MKKISLLLFVFTALNIKAQSFEKKTNVISVGGDLGLYNYVSKVASNPQSSSNGAFNKMLSLQFERGVRNWLGLGVRVQLSDYLAKKDSITNSIPSIKALDGTFFVNAHILRTGKIDLLFGFDLGYSKLNWEARDQFISSATGGGLTYNLHIQPRFYFGNHVGMFVNLAYVNYNYQNLDFKNTRTNISDVLDLNGGGVNFGFGLQLKF